MLKRLASFCALAFSATAFVHATPMGNLGQNSTLNPVPVGTVGTLTQLASTGSRSLNAATFSVAYAETVDMDPTNPLGGLTFIYAFNNIGTSPTDFIDSVTMSNYDAFGVNAFYQVKSGTSVAPSYATRTSNSGATLSNVKFFLQRRSPGWIG